VVTEVPDKSEKDVTGEKDRKLEVSGGVYRFLQVEQRDRMLEVSGVLLLPKRALRRRYKALQPEVMGEGECGYVSSGVRWKEVLVPI
jgi:hypothetical protein